MHCTKTVQSTSDMNNYKKKATVAHQHLSTIPLWANKEEPYMHVHECAQNLPKGVNELSQALTTFLMNSIDMDQTNQLCMCINNYLM